MCIKSSKKSVWICRTICKKMSVWRQMKQLLNEPCSPNGSKLFNLVGFFLAKKSTSTRPECLILLFTFRTEERKSPFSHQSPANSTSGFGKCYLQLILKRLKDSCCSHSSNSTDRTKNSQFSSRIAGKYTFNPYSDTFLVYFIFWHAL